MHIYVREKSNRVTIYGEIRDKGENGEVHDLK